MNYRDVNRSKHKSSHRTPINIRDVLMGGNTSRRSDVKTVWTPAIAVTPTIVGTPEASETPKTAGTTETLGKTSSRRDANNSSDANNSRDT